MPIMVSSATLDDAETLHRIATYNFKRHKSYKDLTASVRKGFIQANSVKRMRLKIQSNRHRVYVCRNDEQILGFVILKCYPDNPAGKYLVGTRIHAIPSSTPLKVTQHLFQYGKVIAQQEGYEYAYVKSSGQSARLFKRLGFVEVGSFDNDKITGAKTTLHIMSLSEDTERNLTRSALIKRVSKNSLYKDVIKNHGLVFEYLFTQIERMHCTGDSSIHQSVLEHLQSGLDLIHLYQQEIQQTGASMEQIEFLWLFHDIGEVGMVQDIPCISKTADDRVSEHRKALKTLASLGSSGLRHAAANLYNAYENPKASTRRKEAVICRWIDKLEAASFIANSGMAAVWQKQLGNQSAFDDILSHHALGNLIQKTNDVIPWVDNAFGSRVCHHARTLLSQYRREHLISQSCYQTLACQLTDVK